VKESKHPIESSFSCHIEEYSGDAEAIQVVFDSRTELDWGNSIQFFYDEACAHPAGES
jgi:hypothetical protein